MSKNKRRTGVVENYVFIIKKKKKFFFFGCPAWHVELPRPEIKPMSPAVEAQSLNH